MSLDKYVVLDMDTNGLWWYYPTEEKAVEASKIRLIHQKRQSLVARVIGRTRLEHIEARYEEER